MPLVKSLPPPHTHHAVVQHELWRQHSLHTQPAVATAVGQIDASRVPYHRPALGQTVEAHLPCEEAIRRSAFFKHLQSRLAAPVARESLVARALAASSTDHPQVPPVLPPLLPLLVSLLLMWRSAGPASVVHVLHRCAVLYCTVLHCRCTASDQLLAPSMPVAGGNQQRAAAHRPQPRPHLLLEQPRQRGELPVEL